MQTLLAMIVTAAANAGEPAPTAKAEALDPPAAVAPAVRDLLAPDAVVVRSAAGDVRVRLWFRTEVPARATAEQVRNGLTYREVPATTLLGVVELPRTFVDFRRQEIAAGVYTLRLAFQPETADHLGTAPHPEFVLLTPAAKDRTPDLMEPKALVERSSAVTGGSHPAVLPLFPAKATDAGPTVAAKANGVVVVSVARPVVVNDVRATLGIAVTIAGHAKE